ncbi:MAG TPA: arginine deiminase-related protein [Dinghuibacter sp.]|nr:arginine deiminase-related protein [Dinghuibacter sp.]HTJ10371.1 arginine deiminase-related protein [Dinghuibacter sp.]
MNFAFNEQTAVNNAFQEKATADAQAVAEREFDVFVALLRDAGVEVLVVNDTPEPYTPDSIFPNNWVSFHTDGTVVLYPMFAPNRRLERKQEVLDEIARNFVIRRRLDLSGWEAKSRYLEGTGSMVLDRDQRIAYACLSPRTDMEVLEDFCGRMEFQPVTFAAADAGGLPIYHTNVMMCVADAYVVICADAISNARERAMVLDQIRLSGKAVVLITLTQMARFAGNMLQVSGASGEKLLVMSSQAFGSLTGEQVAVLGSYNRILHADLSAIETNGGGSARCMMAEVRLPVKKD